MLKTNHRFIYAKYMYKEHAIEAENTLIRVSCMRHQDMIALTVASFAALQYENQYTSHSILAVSKPNRTETV